MFLIILLLVMSLCSLSIFTIYNILEIEKDINTLYDNYSKELEKIILIKLGKVDN